MSGSDSPLAATIRSQHGAISCAQALACGLSRRDINRLVHGSHWFRAAHGVYLTSPVPSWLGRVWAGVLVVRGNGTVGQLAAAHLHGLAGEPDWPITIFHRWQVRLEPQPWWVFRRCERLSRGDLPRTTVEDTILDCWPVLDAEQFVALLGKAFADRRTTAVRLRRVLAGRTRIPRRRQLEEFLVDTVRGAQSPLELRYLRDVERAHGLPAGVRQQSLRPGTKSDVVHEAYRVVVELDGRLGHEGAARFRDLRRDNALLLAGFVTLRFGYVDVRDRPCEVALDVAEMLVRGGWTGAPRRCPRCRGDWGLLGMHAG